MTVFYYCPWSFDLYMFLSNFFHFSKIFLFSPFEMWSSVLQKRRTKRDKSLHCCAVIEDVEKWHLTTIQISAICEVSKNVPKPLDLHAKSLPCSAPRLWKLEAYFICKWPSAYFSSRSTRFDDILEQECEFFSSEWKSRMSTSPIFHFSSGKSICHRVPSRESPWLSYWGPMFKSRLSYITNHYERVSAPLRHSSFLVILEQGAGTQKIKANQWSSLGKKSSLF